MLRHSPSRASLRLLGRMSVQVSSRYWSHSALEASTPVSDQPPGIGRSAGHREDCSSGLIRTLKRASGDSKSKVLVRICLLLPVGTDPTSHPPSSFSTTAPTLPP